VKVDVAYIGVVCEKLLFSLLAVCKVTVLIPLKFFFFIISFLSLYKYTYLSANCLDV